MDEKRRLYIEEYVRTVMAGAQDPDLRMAHDFDHADRVRHWALRIAKTEDYTTLDVLEAAALLHDVGLASVPQRRAHGERSAQLAGDFLRQAAFFDTVQIDAIVYAIRYHNTLKAAGNATLDILRDADMLDLFGAMGIMRAFISHSALPAYAPHKVKGETWGMHAEDFTARFAAGVGIGDYLVDHLNFQISCYDNLHTPTARRLAQPLVRHMQMFVEQLASEVAAPLRESADPSSRV